MVEISKEKGKVKFRDIELKKVLKRKSRPAEALSDWQR